MVEFASIFSGVFMRIASNEKSQTAMRKIGATFVVMVLLLTAVFCGSCYEAENDIESVTVTDMLGENVEIRKNPRKVACVSRTTYDLLIAFGVGDSVDGVYKTLIDNEWATVFDKGISKRYRCEYEESYETFISRQVDLVFAPEKYIADGLKEHGIKALNISLYGKPTFENYVFYFADLVKQIWDSEAVANRVDAWKSYMESAINDIKTEIDGIESPRRKLFYVRGDKNKGIGYTDTHGSFTEYAYNLLGFEFLGTTFDTNKPSAETICAANPDVFVIGGTYQKTLKNLLFEEPYCHLSAVQNNRVFNIPIGLTMFEQLSVFSPVFLHDQANKLYPERFRFDVAKEIKDLSLEFFGISLTDAETENMLNGLSREGNLLA